MKTALQIRVSIQERDRIRALAAGAGLSVSEFVRGRALEAALGDSSSGQSAQPDSVVSHAGSSPVPPASPRAPERTVCPLTPQQLMGRSNGALTLMRAKELVERGGWEKYV